MCLDIESMISFCRNGWQRRIDELPLWPWCSERPGYCGCCALSCRLVQEWLPWGRCIPCAQRLFRGASGNEADWGKAFPLFSFFGKEDIQTSASGAIDLRIIIGRWLLGYAAKWLPFFEWRGCRIVSLREQYPSGYDDSELLGCHLS